VTARVYCFDLVPLRTGTRWTREMDDWLKAEYFPGLSIATLTVDIQKRFGGSGMNEACVTKRLETLRLYSRRKAR
jgi:hypothetical protein